ncbi:MAG TPA: tandem-95 repeat protein [Opitutus sp.]|nr:tandem-95 repeat protein [Opitutus sp.]
MRHSRPGSKNILYLDFNGTTIAGTRWNSTFGVTSYAALPYDTDGDLTTFSDAEQAAIVEIWGRVAEDYAPFDIDVTTEEPATFTATTGRALITAATDANGVALPNAEAAAGVAFVDVFGRYDYATASSPALIYYTSFGSDTAALSEAVAHELGHNLGLSHDGLTNSEYYVGHGTGDISWGPIMGAPYGRNVTQWSRGEYYHANNTQDDVAIIAAHTAYRPTSAGATLTTAAAATVSGTSLSAAGVLTSAADVDVYSFNTSATTISLAVATYRAASGTNGGDADVKLELLNASGSVVASADPSTSTDASLSYKAKAGTYYVRITPVGTGSPQSSRPSGYTSYGSIGQYSLSGTIGASAPAITSATAVTTGGAQSFAYQIVATGSPTSYAATNLPNGLTLDTASGIISGRPLATGVFKIGLSATNALGTGTATLALTVTAAAPAIVAQVSGLQTAAPGDSIALDVTALSASGDPSYRWVHNGRTVSGATRGTLALTGLTAADGGFYQVFVANSVGTTASGLIYVRVAPATTAVAAWGDASAGLTSVPANLTTAVAVAAGYSHVLAVTREGGVRGWGSNAVGETTIPAGVTDAVAVAAGYYDSLALKADGTLAAWGYNVWGQTSIPSGLNSVIAIAGGYAHFLALKSDGTVVAWGDNTYGQAQVPAGLSGVVAIGAGRYHSLAVKADGTVVAWGAASSGQTAVPASLSNAAAAAGGAEHSLALTSAGAVVAWGVNPFGSPPPGGGLTAIAAGYYHSLALQPDGTVAAWGYNNSGETVVPPGLTKVFAIAAGYYCSFAVRDTSVSAATVAPAVTTQPVAQTVNAGDGATFQAAFTGTPAPTLQWQVSADGGGTWSNLADGGFYAGATTGTLSVTGATLAISGEQLRCVATNSAGSAVTSVVTLTVLPVNTAPTISAIATQTVNEDTPSAAIAFTVGDAESAAGDLLVTATSSNTALVPSAGIVLGGSGSARTVALTPSPDANGATTITITVSDGALTSSSSFVLNVTPVNDAPTISAIAAQTVNEDTPTGAIGFTVGDVDNAAADLVVTASSANASLVPGANITLGGSGAARTVTLAPAPNANGATIITVTVSDGSLSSSTSFTLAVTPVNDAPVISSIPNRAVATNGTSGPLAFTIGDVDTAISNLTLTRLSSNTTLVPTANIVLAGSGANRTVTVTPAANRTGTAVITLTVSDGALSATSSFVVTVATPNTAPTITNIANQTVNQGSSTGSIAFTVADAETAAGSLLVTASSSNQTLVPDAAISLGGSSAKRNLKITPVATQNGTAVITVVVSDGELSASSAFVLTVNKVNQSPKISKISNQTVLVSESTSPVAFTVSDAETPASGLTVSATTSSTALVPIAGMAFGGSGGNRTVTVTPAPAKTGTATVTLQVSDGTATTKTSFTVRSVTSNDALADALTLNGLSDEGTGSNVGATKERREPNHAGDAGGRSVWWQWTAPESGPVLVSTEGSNFKTLLAVYTGSSVRTLQAVAASADTSGTLSNAVLFDAVAGTTYAIAVDGYRGATGSIVLDVVQGPAASLAPLDTTILSRSRTAITIANVLAIPAGASGFSAHVALPAQWSFVSGDASGADLKPAAGDTGVIDWAWAGAHGPTVQFTYTLALPPRARTPASLEGLIIVPETGGALASATATPLR